ncbi:DUF3231 family protein [Alkalihalobacterium bogoriense]|uniref:DUF3231 family protein n=1 Tax=Alkalihalobacterium bogoriense TaxID=246272 RepID=UPI000479A6CC|nr:DUF3231 family protein [Alkalihalobacterium bogoriense]
MSTHEDVKITSSEMASLWSAYINQTHSICTLEYFLAKVEDDDVKETLKSTYQDIESMKNACKQLLQDEQVPIPTAFGTQDVDVNAPRLFSDSFSLMYVKNLLRMMVASNGLMFTMSTRKDVRELFKGGLSKATNLFNEISDTLLEKGIYTRPPFIEPPKKSDFIEDKDYLNGIDLFSDQRFLNTIEISHVFANIEANVIGSTLTKAFAQTADIKEVREFMENAGQLSEKIVNSLTQFLTGSQLPAPMASETQVLSSSQPPFSDRMMMYEMTVLSSAGLSDYATSLATSSRNDLKRHYMDLINDTTKIAKKAETIMIKNHWLEQPPQQDRIIP